MTRPFKVAEVADPFLGSPDQDRERSLHFDIEALTPIYKGAAHPNGIDEKYPFRGTALRGQLRMWWRALRPTTSAADLWEEEYRLFGGVHGNRPRASRVRVGVMGMQSQPARMGDLSRATGGSYRYALGMDNSAREGIKYHLNARGEVLASWGPLLRDEPKEPRERDPEPALLDTVRPALEAMVLFGGMGSRTRRGLGRLWSKKLFGDGFSGPEELAERIAPWCPVDKPRPWPSLSGVRVLWWPHVFGKPGEAVDHALNAFQKLRGMENLGNGHFYGGNRLPEAQRDWERVRDGRDLDGAFTAALGMPLVYRSFKGKHLKGETRVTPRVKGDRRGTYDRLPSPVQIRPVPVKGGGYAAVIFALRPWFEVEILAVNGEMHRRNRGRLDPSAVDILVDGFRRRDWRVCVAGGAR